MKKQAVLIVIVFIISFAFFVSSETFAKYKSVITQDGSAVPAIPIVENNISSITVPLNINEPGSVQEYPFYIKNERNSIISQVMMDYVISIETSSNLPLTFELFKGEGITNVFDSNLVSPTYTLTNGTSVNDIYNLKITWPSIENDYRFEDLTEAITIKVSATQHLT